jgi:hypothetical protein
VFKSLRRRLLCAMGKHELVYCEDIPIVGFSCYRFLHCGFLTLAAKHKGRRHAIISRIVLTILAAAIFAVLLVLASRLVGL